MIDLGDRHAFMPLSAGWFARGAISCAHVGKLGFVVGEVKRTLRMRFKRGRTSRVGVVGEQPQSGAGCTQRAALAALGGRTTERVGPAAAAAAAAGDTTSTCQESGNEWVGGGRCCSGVGNVSMGRRGHAGGQALTCQSRSRWTWRRHRRRRSNPPPAGAAAQSGRGCRAGGRRRCRCCS